MAFYAFFRTFRALAGPENVSGRAAAGEPAHAPTQQAEPARATVVMTVAYRRAALKNRRSRRSITRFRAEKFLPFLREIG
jgi:hypothetical protein